MIQKNESNTDGISLTTARQELLPACPVRFGPSLRLALMRRCCF
jgi:hypothetical protein